jgi:dolichol-phosphate mannosyltransferase
MCKPTAVVVIPTYNESATIGRLLDHLFDITFPKIKKWNCKILIVDGKSPDNTAEIVHRKQNDYPNLDLLVEEKKEGIGAAYVKGFRRAIEHHKSDVIIEFDGDFQHPPEAIALMLDEIDKGADYVLGSRKVKGGSYPKGWGFKRLLFSKAGGLLARFILFFPMKTFFEVTDPTTGLKASRVNGFVDKLNFGHLYSRRFGYKLEFLYGMNKHKAKIVEIPLKFQSRDAGESKITSNTPLDILWTAILLRLKDPVTLKFLKFCVVGFSGFVLNVVALELFRKASFVVELSEFFNEYADVRVLAILSKKSAWAAGFAAEIAIISNYLMNNFWTFSVDKITKVLRFISKMVQFNLTSFGAIIIQFLVIGSATMIFGDTSLVRKLALVFSVVFLIIPYNWTVYNKLIWRRKKKE